MYLVIKKFIHGEIKMRPNELSFLKIEITSYLKKYPSILEEISQLRTWVDFVVRVKEICQENEFLSSTFINLCFGSQLKEKKEVYNLAKSLAENATQKKEFYQFNIVPMLFYAMFSHDIEFSFKLLEHLCTKKDMINNIGTYGALISASKNLKSFDLAERIFKAAQGSTIRCGIRIYNIMLSVAVEHGKFTYVEQLFNDIKFKEDIQPNIVTYTTMIKLAGQCGRFDDVQKLFDELRSREDIQLDIVTYNTMLDLAGYAGQFPYAQKFFDELKSKKDIQPNSMTCAAMIRVAEQCHELEYLKNLLHDPEIYKLIYAGIESNGGNKKTIDLHGLNYYSARFYLQEYQTNQGFFKGVRIIYGRGSHSKTNMGQHPLKRAVKDFLNENGLLNENIKKKLDENSGSLEISMRELGFSNIPRSDNETNSPTRNQFGLTLSATKKKEEEGETSTLPLDIVSFWKAKYNKSKASHTGLNPGNLSRTSHTGLKSESFSRTSTLQKSTGPSNPISFWETRNHTSRIIKAVLNTNAPQFFPKKHLKNGN